MLLAHQLIDHPLFITAALFYEENGQFYADILPILVDNKLAERMQYNALLLLFYCWNVSSRSTMKPKA